MNTSILSVSSLALRVMESSLPAQRSTLSKLCVCEGGNEIRQQFYIIMVYIQTLKIIHNYGAIIFITGDSEC